MGTSTAFNFLEEPLNPQRLQVEIRNCLDGQERDRHLQVVRRRLRDLGMRGGVYVPSGSSEYISSSEFE